MKINSVFTSDKNFPEKLKNIPTAPSHLFYRGTLPDESRLHVAIVGSRKPTAYGTEITLKLAEGLARRGAVIVSGLALGVDAIAHQGALNVGGTTIAVLAGGVDKPSPFTNRHIAEGILDGHGAIISEFEPGTAPRIYSFPIRNRIVSGLADILIVTEASDRSGTMNTVSHALAQGKDVYAVPGDITKPNSRGCNRIIFQGASPIVDIDEFIDSVTERAAQPLTLFAASPDEQAILDLLQSGIRDGDELQQKSGLQPHVFAQTLTMMELQGSITPLGANNWSLK